MPASGSPLGLPAELQVEIAKFADDRSLLALRLVNRELSANCFEEFGERFFAHRRHVTTGHSLEVLRNITATPQLARHIQSLHLYTIGVDLEYDEYLVRDCSVMPGAFPIEEDSVQPWCRDMDDSITWEYFDVLVKIFRNLSKLQASITLHLKHSEWPFMSPDERARYHLPKLRRGFAAIHGMASYVRSVRPWASRDEVIGRSRADLLVAVRQALLESTFQPHDRATSLATSTNSSPRLSGEETRKLQTNCRRLKTLELAFPDEIPEDGHTITVHPVIKSIMSASPASTHLTMLGATLPFLKELTWTSDAPTFQSICISHAFVSVKSLAPFLASYKKTLRELGLKESRLRTNGKRWSDVLGALLESLELRRLTLKNLFQLVRVGQGEECPQYKVFADSAKKILFEAEVGEDVRKLLRRLLDEGDLRDFNEERDWEGED